MMFRCGEALLSGIHLSVLEILRRSISREVPYHLRLELQVLQLLYEHAISMTNGCLQSVGL